MGLEKKSKKKEEPTRRGILFGLGALVATSAAGVQLEKQSQKRDSLFDDPNIEKLPPVETTPEDPLSFLNVDYKPTLCKAGPLINVKVSNALTDYTGYKGKMPEEIPFDPRYRLAELWKIKLKQIKSVKGEYPPHIISALGRMFADYKAPPLGENSTLEEYRQSIQAMINGNRASINLGSIIKLDAFAKFIPDQVELLQRMERKITPDTLLSSTLR